jgi:O-antigen/teichoic acid export membrane protein
MVPVSSVGDYSLARRFRNLMIFFSDPLLTVIYPRFSMLWSGGKKFELRGLVKKISGVSFWVAVFAFAVLSLIIPALIPLLFGESFGSTAVMCAMIFVADASMLLYMFFVPALLLSFGIARYAVVASTVSLVSVAILGPFLVSAAGPVGMAIAVALASMGSLLWMYRRAMAILEGRNVAPVT